jgi:hypothetical protein
VKIISRWLRSGDEGPDMCWGRKRDGSLYRTATRVGEGRGGRVKTNNIYGLPVAGHTS